MAPRRGGGGGGGGSSGGSSGPVCPGFLSSGSETVPMTDITYYVSYCLFFVLTVAILISLCCVRRKPTKLSGPFLLASLSFTALGWALVIIGRTISECHVGSPWMYYNFSIAFRIFFNVGQFLVLVIVVWGVNTMLAKRLNSGKSFVKIITLAIVGFMGALTIAYTAFWCYILYQLTPEGQRSRGFYGYEYSSSYYKQLQDQVKLGLAYWVLYLVSVLAAGALSLSVLIRMRSKNILVGDLMLWTIILTTCMLLWVILTMVPFAAAIDNAYLGYTTDVAIYYVGNFFLIFAYIAIIILGRSQAWNNGDPSQTAYNNMGYASQPVYTPAPVGQQQYAYNGQPGQQYAYNGQPGQQYAYNGQPGQQYYYQQQPVYNGTPAAATNNGHMVQIK